VLFAQAVLNHEYSFTAGQTLIVAGFYYQNRPLDIENNAGEEVRVLAEIKAGALHMSASAESLEPGSYLLSLEMTKRGNSPQLSSALPLSFDIPLAAPVSFTFPAKARCVHVQPLHRCLQPLALCFLSPLLQL
jgi:hypothetical protein